MEGMRGDHRGEGGEEEVGSAEERNDGSEDSSRDGHEDAMELDDEDPPNDESMESDVSDDEDEPLEDGDCKDDDDFRIFGGTNISKYYYFNQILPLKHNDGKKICFELHGIDLSNEAWARLGDFLSRNTHVHQIRIIDCNLTANKLALLFGSGPFQSNLIDRLSLESNPMIGSEGVTALKPFFKKTSSPTQLTLYNMNLGPEGLKRLSLELDGLPSLRHLNLRHNNIGDEGLEGISPLCFSRLSHLYLEYNSIGRRGFEVIAHLLRSDESSLVNLCLGNLDDGCTEIFVRSLAKNTTLEMLFLDVRNESISCVGWESIRQLVCDTSSVSATYGSNHTLQWTSARYGTESTKPITLKCALAENERPGTLKEKACRKIINHHFDKGNSPGPLVDMDVKLMPHVFSWISQRSDEDFGVGCRNNIIYQILRRSNVCAFVQKDIAPPV